MLWVVNCKHDVQLSDVEKCFFHTIIVDDVVNCVFCKQKVFYYSLQYALLLIYESA